FFCLFMLSARGVQVLGQLMGTTISRVLAISLFAFLSLSAAAALPERLPLYKGYNDVNSDLEKAVKAEHVSRAVILLGNGNWRDWNSAAKLLAGDFEADLIFAWNANDNSALFNAYADRPVYLWSDANLKLYLQRASEGLRGTRSFR
ncbi:MAG TPA: hypothetical protein VJ521_08905, partial [Acidobacteriota bacterium]|nr:hypothetical protein [Acidobacteriota bacterium]